MASNFDLKDDRHFTNESVDYSFENAKDYITSSSEIVLERKEFLIKKIKELLIILDNEVQNLSSKDVSIYTGLSGIGYFYFKISSSTEFRDISQNNKSQCDHLVRRCLRHLKGKPGSFLCDDTGPLTLSVLLNIEDGSFDKIVKMSDYVIKSNDLPDEMLYGRCGYLVALLILNKYKRNVPSQLIKKIYKAIINSGLKLAKLRREEIKNLPPLFYEWHEKPYLGAAHGMSGIMFMLLQIYLDESLTEIHSEIKQDIFEYVYPTIAFLAKLRLASGNYPSSLGESSKRDVLIHWCHGAPGWIHMFIAAHKVFKDPIYLDRIKEIGEVIWNRGLLYKGCGICHGTAGNGYAFLALYKHTNEPKYLYRALKFAEWCTDFSKNRTRVADRPFSLFEGLAGTIHFLVDCLDPHNAKFPVYEI